MLTGKSRAIIQKFSISQTSVRILARAGSISGIKKASWLFFSFCGEIGKHNGFKFRSFLSLLVRVQSKVPSF